MFLQRLVAASLTLFLISCASLKKNRDAQNQLKNLTSNGQYSKAIELVKGDDFFPEERSALLKKLELATLYYLDGKLFQALKTFDQAKELSDKLYTESLSKALTAAITNANQDNYYGEKYERSLLRFYLALVHYGIYEQGRYEAYSIFEKLDNGKLKEKKVPQKDLSLQERRQHLFSARAMILEWDSLLSNYKETYSGKNIYKIDLMAKVFGAFIHEQIGTRSDLNIAKQLYRDAKIVLFKYYNLYPTYNGKYKSFAKDYEKLPKLSKNKIKKDYIVETQFAKDLHEFIDKRLKNLKKKNKDNVKIILKDGFVAKKTAREIDFPLPMLRLGYVSGRETDLFVFTLEMLAISRGTKPSISFELPGIEDKKVSYEYFAVVKDKAGKEIKREKVYLINPVSDIAWQNLDVKSSSFKKKIGTRVALKHVAAILAAYKIYKSRPDGFGKLAAGLSYAAANKAIAASEKVDLRQWTTLPHNMRIASLYLPKGEYTVELEAKTAQKTIIAWKKKITVDKKKVQYVDVNLYKVKSSKKKEIKK